ncbi:hypothetical protein BLM14_14675 [Phyllobacterium zundukense]|nr:hypothetical protein BLM14_14675 [Phyllobacterium zundukense]
MLPASLQMHTPATACFIISLIKWRIFALTERAWRINQCADQNMRISIMPRVHSIGQLNRILYVDIS